MAPTRPGADKPGKRRGRPTGSRNSISTLTPRSSSGKVAKGRGRTPGSRNSIHTSRLGSKTHAVKDARDRKRKTNTQEGGEQSGAKRKREAGANEGERERTGKKRGRPNRVSNDDLGEEVDELSAELTQAEVIPTTVRRADNLGRVQQSSSATRRAGHSRRRKEQVRDDNDDADELCAEQTEAHEYMQLAPRTRRIAREVIETWPLVSPPVLDQIVRTLRDAKKDIVNTQRDEQRAIAADETLGSIVRMLERRLSSSRIPPQAKDVHFNIDKLTEGYAQVFRELTTERHSHQLLTEQIKVAQHLLEKDEESLDQLKKNSSDWKTRWKQQEKQGRMHPLLKDMGTEIEGDGPDDIGLKRSKVVDVSMIDAPDSELAPLLEQLRRSLESMQDNHEQVGGIEVGMRNAQVALDDVLFKHANAEQHAAAQ